MNIVTICRGGNVRSVAAKMILSRYLGHEVIAIGADNTNNETKKLVFDWADKIVVMNKDFLPFLKWKEPNYDCAVLCYDKFDYTNKSILLDVGNDIWGDPFNEELQLLIAQLINNSDSYNEIRADKTINYAQVVQTIQEYKEKIKQRNLTDGII